MGRQRLSKKQKGFIDSFVKDQNATQAVLDNYDIEDRDLAASMGSRLLKTESIREIVGSIADNIPDSLLVDKHMELLTVPRKIRKFIKGDLVNEYEEVDSSAIGKGLDMAYKLKGSYAAEKSLNMNLNVDINTHDPKAIELAKEYEAKLRGNL